MAQKLNPFTGRQFQNASGIPYSGAQLFTYVAGSATKATTTKDLAGTAAHANPIVLNSKGEVADGAGAAQSIWQAEGSVLKLVLAPVGDTDPPTSAISSWDNIAGINDTTTTIDEWILGATPTYVNATSFTLVGDQTTDYHVGRRLKTTNSAGTIYSTITVSAYTSLTTITVVNDSGTLDSGLSAVSYGLISFANTSAPSQYSSSTWTPALQDASFSDGEGQTYSNRYATYTKIGNRVFISGSMSMSALGTISGSMFLAGLPFTATTGGATYNSGVTVVGSNLSVTAGQNTEGRIQDSVTYITLWLNDSTGGATQLQVGELTSSSILSFSGSYTTDA